MSVASRNPFALLEGTSSPLPLFRSSSSHIFSSMQTTLRDLPLPLHLPRLQPPPPPLLPPPPLRPPVVPRKAVEAQPPVVVVTTSVAVESHLDPATARMEM